MEASEVSVVKSEQFKTFRSEIRPEGLDQLLAYITAMDAEMRVKKFTGRLVIDWNQGGKRRIVAEEVAHEYFDDEVPEEKSGEDVDSED